MKHWIKRLFAIAAPLLLTGCLWGPGKFTSDLTLKKDGSFILDYKGEIVLQLPPDAGEVDKPWTPSMAHCVVPGSPVAQSSGGVVVTSSVKPPAARPCSKDEIATQ